MLTFINHLTIIAVVLVIAVVCLIMFSGTNLSDLHLPKGQMVKKKPDCSDKEGGTCYMSSYVLEEIDGADKVKVRHDLPAPNLCKKGITIGRSSTCDLTVKNSPYIGRHHATIAHDEKGYFIQDNESKNGMFNVYKEKVCELDLKNNTTFYLAGIKFRFRVINPWDDLRVPKKEVTNTAFVRRKN